MLYDPHLETKALFSSTQSTEVLGCLGNNIGAQVHDNAPSGFAANRHIEVNLGVRPVGNLDARV